MTLYTENEGEYFQKLPFSMKRKTLIRILEKARKQREIRYTKNVSISEQMYFGDYNHVIIWIDGEFYKIAEVIFSNGTGWDYIHGIIHPNFIQRYSKAFFKTFMKYCKRFTIEQRITLDQERQRLMQNNSY